MLNKLEMMEALVHFMNERKEHNDFAFEKDIKEVQCY